MLKKKYKDGKSKQLANIKMGGVNNSTFATDQQSFAMALPTRIFTNLNLLLQEIVKQDNKTAKLDEK